MTTRFRAGAVLRAGYAERQQISFSSADTRAGSGHRARHRVASLSATLTEACCEGHPASSRGSAGTHDRRVAKRFRRSCHGASAELA